MAKPQLPIDGKQGKAWRVTSDFGWRMHPVRKVKAHHNGLDIWSVNENTYIEAPFDGKVIYAGPSKAKNKDGSVGGFGYYVQILFAWQGEWYISTHAHMKQGSLKVKVGQKIEAGTVVGIMGATGMVDGRHLHWEITKGKKYVWSNNGKGYVHPLKFTQAAIAMFEAKAFAAVETPDTDPVADAPVHEPVKVAPKVAPKASGKTHKVKAGDSYWAIGEKYGVDFKALQKLNGNKALNPGDIVKLP